MVIPPTPPILPGEDSGFELHIDDDNDIVIPPPPPPLHDETSTDFTTTMTAAITSPSSLSSPSHQLRGTHPPLYHAICLKCPAQVLQTLQHSRHDEIGALHGHTRYTYMHLLIMVVNTGRDDTTATNGQLNNSNSGNSTGSDEEKCLSIVYQLSNAGVDVNAADTAGLTALEMAIKRGLTHIMVGSLQSLLH